MSYSIEQFKQQLKNYGITNEELISKSENRMSEIISMINATELDNEILWDKTVDRYYKSTRKLLKILEHENIKDSVSNTIIKNLNNFIDVCKKPEFHIAFVGAIKADKSTLINALLGKNLASTSVTPETASLTKFRASKGKNYINLSFYTTEEWDKLWESIRLSKAEVFLEEYNNLNAEGEKSNWLDKSSMKIEFDNLEDLKDEIKRWTSSKESTHYFVKEVEVGLSDFKLPEGVIFVDTPGLDDPVKYRSDITRMYIDRANAVFVCVNSHSLRGQELGTIYKVFANSKYNPEKVYIIGTQLDSSFNEPIEDWKEQKQEWLKHLSKSDCYGSMKLAQNNLFITAAYLYNMCIDFNNLSKQGIRKLKSISLKFDIEEIEENLNKLIDYSQIENLKAKLNQEVIEKYKSLLINDIKAIYQSNKEDIEDLFTKIKNNQLEILELANADIDKIKKEKEKNKEILKESEEEKKELEKSLNEIRENIDQQAKLLCNEIKKIGSGLNV